MTTPIPKYIADYIAEFNKPQWVTMGLTQEAYIKLPHIQKALEMSVHNPTGAWLNGKIPKMDDCGNIIPNQFFMVAKKKPTVLSSAQQPSEEWVYFKGAALPVEAVMPAGMAQAYEEGQIYYSKKSHWCWTKWASHETQQQMTQQGIKWAPGMYGDLPGAVVAKPVKASIPLLSSYALRTASRPSKLLA